MGINLGFHRIKEIRIESVRRYDADDQTPLFFSRTLCIYMEGNEYPFRLGLFGSDNEEQLFLRDMRGEPIEQAFEDRAGNTGRLVNQEPEEVDSVRETSGDVDETTMC